MLFYIPTWLKFVHSEWHTRRSSGTGVNLYNPPARLHRRSENHNFTLHAVSSDPNIARQQAAVTHVTHVVTSENARGPSRETPFKIETTFSQLHSVISRRFTTAQSHGSHRIFPTD